MKFIRMAAYDMIAPLWLEAAFSFPLVPIPHPVKFTTGGNPPSHPPSLNVHDGR